MNIPPFTPQTLISEVLERQPEAMALFIARGTDCVGCIMAPFCTLGEMSLHYGVELDAFLGEPGKAGGGESLDHGRQIQNLPSHGDLRRSTL
jgi:hypothetical protein